MDDYIGNMPRKDKKKVVSQGVTECHENLQYPYPTYFQKYLSNCVIHLMLHTVAPF